MASALPKLVRVESSSIDSVGYDPDTRRLFVRFVESGNAYVYADVAESVFNEFLASSSKGRFFNDEVKGVYAYRRL